MSRRQSSRTCRPDEFSVGLADGPARQGEDAFAEDAKGSRCVIDGAEEPFDNTCDELHFPVDAKRPGRLSLTLTMENAHRVEGDERELALALRGLQWLL